MELRKERRQTLLAEQEELQKSCSIARRASARG
jgi:hypothetical protein